MFLASLCQTIEHYAYIAMSTHHRRHKHFKCFVSPLLDYNRDRDYDIVKKSIFEEQLTYT